MYGLNWNVCMYTVQYGWTDSCRQISILSSLSNLFEIALSIWLERCLNRFNVMEDEKDGFRKGKSTKTILVHFMELIIQVMNKVGQGLISI